MDIKKVRALLKVVEENDIAEIEVEQDGLRIMIRKTNDAVYSAASIPAAATPIVAAAPVAAASAPAVEESEEDPGGTILRSPIVGTFYTAPSPDDDDFAKVGDVVSEGQVVCIIEAMKIMNEIESEFSGKVLKVLVENAQPVEYDQPLFLIAS